MFVSLNKETGARLTSIDPRWASRLEELREMTRSGLLVCCGCDQKLWLRVGGGRRPHFAHRSLADCPLAQESVEVMEAKAKIYLWLSTKYPGKAELDVDLKIPGWKRYADLVLRSPSEKAFIYWIFDRQQRERAVLLSRKDTAMQHHFIHTESTLDLHGEELRLTASQRDFIEHSDYNKLPFRNGSGHLTFFDSATSEVSIYRALVCVHQPNVFAWKLVRKGPLSKALIRPKTGEMLFPRDVEALAEWREKERARQAAARAAEEKRKAEEEERKAKEQERRAREQERRRLEQEMLARLLAAQSAEEQSSEDMEAEDMDVEDPETGAENENHILAEREAVEEEPGINLNGPFRCEDCGQETTEWSSASPTQGTCICKACTEKRWLAKRKFN
jgi:hypothetical protein